jgi:DNA-binding transcriptional ArsR family regulator
MPVIKKTNESGDEDFVLERLDRIAEVLELALSPQLEGARSRLRADSLDAAIFDHTAGRWVPAGELQHKVAAATGAKKRTLQEHLSALVENGFLKKDGAGPSVRYRSSGLI